MFGTSKNPNGLVTAALWVTILLWASAFVGIRVGLEDYTPGAFALLRYLIASLFIFILYRCLPKRPRLRGGERCRAILSGMLGMGVYTWAVNSGELTVTAGIASFMIGLMPVFSMLLAVVFLRERVSSAIWWAVGISLVGIMVIALGESAAMSFNHGVSFLLLAAFSQSIYVILQKPLLEKYDALSMTAWAVWGGTLFLLIFLPDLPAQMAVASWKTDLVVLYLGIFPAVIAYGMWTYVLSKMSACHAVMSLYAMPLASTAMGIVLLSEVPPWVSLLGALIAWSGAILVSWQRRRERVNAVQDSECH